MKIATPASEIGGDEIRADLEASDAPPCCKLHLRTCFFLGKKLTTCSELAIQSVMNLRSKAPVRKLVEVATGMIDGEMDAISYCSLFSKFLFANARYEVF